MEEEWCNEAQGFGREKMTQQSSRCLPTTVLQKRIKEEMTEKEEGEKEPREEGKEKYDVQPQSMIPNPDPDPNLTSCDVDLPQKANSNSDGKYPYPTQPTRMNWIKKTRFNP